MYMLLRTYIHDPVKTYVKIFVRGRFYGSYYCSSLKFCMRIYNVYKYKRNMQESGYDDPYVMVH